LFVASAVLVLNAARPPESAMRAQVSVEIDRPIDEVFDFTITHVAEWSITVIEDEVIEEKPGHVGTTFRCLTESQGRKMEFQGVITKYDCPTLSASYLTGDAFDIDVEYAFEDVSGKTRVTQTSIVIPKGFTKVFFILFGWAMNKSNCSAAENELQNLKHILESREEPATT
jgi:hypothetical protein